MSSKLHNLNSKLHKFINKNKTFKNYYKRKIQFVNNIITNWKKIVHGNIHIDNKTIYKNKIIHSKPYTISIFSNPKTVVLNMINNYIKFI
jgi:hypothetical protein